MGRKLFSRKGSQVSQPEGSPSVVSRDKFPTSPVVGTFPVAQWELSSLVGKDLPNSKLFRKLPSLRMDPNEREASKVPSEE